MSGTVQNDGAGGRDARDEGEPPLAVLVIGMSAGALGALKTFLVHLPGSFAAPIVIAHHAAAPSILPELIRHWTGRRAMFAREGAPIRPQTIYVGPVAHHVMIKPNASLGVSSTERIEYVRPSVNWLFESAAAAYDERVIAIVLSGANGDGARGARCIARAGGRVIVQRPDTCDFKEMPSAVLASVPAALPLPARDIATYAAAEHARIETTHAGGACWRDPFAAGATS